MIESHEETCGTLIEDVKTYDERQIKILNFDPKI